MKELPIVAVTLGDPCGIGPEVVVKAISLPELKSVCTPVVIGSSGILRDIVNRLGIKQTVTTIKSIQEIPTEPTRIGVLDQDNLDLNKITLGEISSEAGKASVEWIDYATKLCLSGDVQAMATAPINKEAVALAGYKEIGHMERIQKLTNSKEVATMLVSGELRVVHLTTHRSLRNACDAVTRENVLAKIFLTHEHFKLWGFARPRIGVAALNPHASDGGLLGSEEALEIKPAVDEAEAAGIRVEGPIPADTVFLQGINGEYDVILCMYHDQGHIPVKVHGFEESISVNLGFPLIRTSVDHGTAFDIAGKGIAQAISMTEAIKLAASLAAGKGLPRWRGGSEA